MCSKSRTVIYFLILLKADRRKVQYRGKCTSIKELIDNFQLNTYSISAYRWLTETGVRAFLASSFTRTDSSATSLCAFLLILARTTSFLLTLEENKTGQVQATSMIRRKSAAFYNSDLTSPVRYIVAIWRKSCLKSKNSTSQTLKSHLNKTKITYRFVNLSLQIRIDG